MAVASVVRYFMHCEAADHSWRWKTSSEAYGNHWSQVGKEVHKENYIHQRCAEKLCALANELYDTRACLELARVSGAKVPRLRSAGAPYDSGRYFAGSPKIGDCDCKNKPSLGCGNPFRTVNEREYNGGHRHHRQLLDDHIKMCHPRLVKRLQPKLPLSSTKEKK
ncbi:uncharacterized protein [Physcomitrium patens]|nr:uncharacterized protein LOC112283407 [Physcomitrium patens]|eukprot:XP_024377801.1 uncharacterized protein LOC112283407 [Physcomitrella patens]